MAGREVLALITLFLCAVLDTCFDVEKCCCTSTCEQEAAVRLKGTKATPGFMWKLPIFFQHIDAHAVLRTSLAYVIIFIMLIF